MMWLCIIIFLGSWCFHGSLIWTKMNFFKFGIIYFDYFWAICLTYLWNVRFLKIDALELICTLLSFLLFLRHQIWACFGYSSIMHFFFIMQISFVYYESCNLWTFLLRENLICHFITQLCYANFILCSF